MFASKLNKAEQNAKGDLGPINVGLENRSNWISVEVAGLMIFINKLREDYIHGQNR